MIKIDPAHEETARIQKMLLGAVAPRPIAFASTIDREGVPNLSPFSFFNAFSANPPVLVFSPARRVRNSSVKHTLENVLETREAVISVVTLSMAEKMVHTSRDFPREVSEFEEAGFTPVAADEVAPYLVKESPVNFECRVKDVVELGSGGGAGNLVICEVIKMHIAESILNDEGEIDPLKADLIGRFGGKWYCKTSSETLFQL
ncbi:MAG: flavin reductase family protein [Flavobacteriales bacterium]